MEDGARGWCEVEPVDLVSTVRGGCAALWQYSQNSFRYFMNKNGTALKFKYHLYLSGSLSFRYILLAKVQKSGPFSSFPGAFDFGQPHIVLARSE